MKTLDCQEVYWRQRAKVQWHVEGDRNSAFFHAFASNRRRSNRINGLWNDDGVWETNPDGLAAIAMKHFHSVFASSKPWEEDISAISRLLTVRVTQEMQRDLDREFTAADVKLALDQMHPMKAPGPDGFNALFFQSYWDTMGGSVCKQVLLVLNNGGDLLELGHTNIVLIPKVKSPVIMSEFRPISLCNVVFKLVSKCIVNRLKPWLSGLVSEFQSTFVAGRLIQDNMIIAYEMAHSLVNKKIGSQGYVAAKLDIVKAYDKLEWPYIQSCLRGLGFSERWVRLMMKCVTEVSYSVLVNGNEAGVFSPSRGLRQGDPLSPILYVLCSEGLSALFDHKVESNLLEGGPICRNGVRFTRLLFADDSLVFLNASMNECYQLQDVLDMYARASGQEVNFSKSSIMFSSNVSMELQNAVKDLLGVHTRMEDGKYLGLPLIIGRQKSITFGYIKDRFREKLAAWKGKLLSMAGRDVMIKVVLQAIPSYVFSIFKMPMGLCKELEAICARFFWGASTESRKVHWVSWQSMCKPRRDGGLGFRRLEAFNMALLAKHGWRILSDPNALVCRVLKQKYFPRGTFLQSCKQRNSSYLWKGIMDAKVVLVEGGRWRIGDGLDVIISDKWVMDCASVLEDQSESDISNNAISSMKVSDLIMLLHDVGSQMWLTRCSAPE